MITHTNELQPRVFDHLFFLQVPQRLGREHGTFENSNIAQGLSNRKDKTGLNFTFWQSARTQDEEQDDGAWRFGNQDFISSI